MIESEYTAHMLSFSNTIGTIGVVEFFTLNYYTIYVIT